MRRVALLSLLLSPFAASALLAGEIRGKVFSDEKPAAGATVVALPHETPFEAALREARHKAPPAPIATTFTKADGSFALSVTSAPGKPEVEVMIKVVGSAVFPALADGTYGSGETADAVEIQTSKAAPFTGRVVERGGAPVAGADVTMLELEGWLRPLHTVRTAEDGSFRFAEAHARFVSLDIHADGFAPGSVRRVPGGSLKRPIVLERGVTLTGTVRKAAGRGSSAGAPATGALVRFEAGTFSRWVEAGEDGTFTLTDVPASIGKLVAVVGDGGYGELLNVNPRASENKPLTVTLGAPAAFEGRAMDAATGRAVARVKVRAVSEEASITALSGPDGTYRLRVPPGQYDLRADEPRYATYMRLRVNVAAGETKKVDLPLTLGASIAGRVLDEEGQPVAGAAGHLAWSGLRATRMMTFRGEEAPAFRTGADGTFRAARLSPGEGVTLTVTHPEFTKARLGGLTLAPGGTRAGLNVTLARGHVVEGLVVDTEERPIEGADVTIYEQMPRRFTRNDGPDPVARSGSDGRFVLKGVAPGAYSLNVSRQGYAYERVSPLTVRADERPAPLVVRLQPGVAITGAVKKRDGSPAEGVLVNAGAMGSPNRRMSAPTGADGSFSLDGLRVGESFDVSVMGPTGPRGTKNVVAPAEGVELVVSASGRIDGRAVDAQSGRPIPEMTVGYRASGPGGGTRFSSRGGRGMFDEIPIKSEDGAFTLEELPAGTLDVSVSAKGYQRGRTTVTLEDGERKDGVEVRLAKASSLAGRVTDARTGRPVADVSISLSPGPTIRFGFGEGILTDADGRFVAEDLAPGKLRVTASHPDYADAIENAEVPEGHAGTLEMKLSSGGVLAGIVVAESRQGVPGAQVRAAAEGATGRMTPDDGSRTTDDSGRFRISHLGAGRYRVSADASGRSAPPQTVVLQDGESREDLVITLSPGITVRGTVSGLRPEDLAKVRVGASARDWSGPGRMLGDGRFELTGVPAGDVVLYAHMGEGGATGRIARKPLTLTDGQTDVETEIVFEEGWTLSGRVTRRDEPVPQTLVMASVAGGGTSSAYTNGQGEYRIEGLKAGEYTVRVMSGPYGGLPLERKVTVSSDTTLDMAYPAARIAGLTVESGSRQPLTDVTVQASQERAGRGAMSDSTGRFLVTDLEPGPYTLQARKQGFRLARLDAEASEAGGEDVVIELVRGEGIGIQAKDGIYGVPLGVVYTQVLDGQRKQVFNAPIPLDGEGRGEIPSLPPGTYTLVASASGYAASELTVSAPSSGVTVVLTPGGALEIRSGARTIEAGRSVRLLRASGAPALSAPFQGLDAKFTITLPVRRFEHLTPGGYLLAVDGGETKAFTIMEGGTTVVELP